MGWLVPGFLLGLLTGLLLWRWVAGRREKGYLAICEYWVYVSDPRVPATEQFMTRMISDNPHNRKGRACITNREGLLFTDVRLRITSVLKSKNPKLFRPDLFDDEVTPTQQSLEALAESKGLIRLLYASQQPLKDTRHLQFLPHLADTMSDLCGGLAVLDVVSRELLPAQEFKKRLSENPLAERPEAHIRVAWRRTANGWAARTFGLRKVGRPEWETEVQESDMEVLATGLATHGAYKVFRSPDDQGPFSMEAYGAKFSLSLLDQWKDSRQLVRLTREALS